MARLWIAMLAMALLVGCGEEKKKDAPKPADQPKDAPKTSMNDAAMPTVTTVSFNVPTMECPLGCAPKVESTLAGQPGFVKKVEVNVETKTATIEVAEGFSAEAAVAALTEAGFDGSTVKN